MPEVRIHSDRLRSAVVACPLCEVLIARTSLAWRWHMETIHSATPGTWDDLGIRGAQIGPAEGNPNHVRFGDVCVGCTASFPTEAELVAHLLAVHDAS